MEKHSSKKDTIKKTIKRVVLLVLVFGCAFLYAHIEKMTYFYDKAIETNDYISTGILVDEEITQNFVSEEDYLDGIQAKCTINGAVDDNITIEYSLTDMETKEIVAQGVVLGSDVKNSKFTKFGFSQLSGCKGKKYAITFRENGSDDMNGISFYLVQDTKNDMELSVKGNDTAGILVARTLTNRFDMETFVVVLIFVLYISLFMKMLYKLFK